MGSKAGYGYRYEFHTVHEDEIFSKYKSKRKPGSRGFLFEFRTNFILLKTTTSAEEEGEEVKLDSETFDGYVESMDDEVMMETFLHCMIHYRLEEYWMSFDEIKSLVKEALAFANEPKYAFLNPVPIAVRLDVCTLQRADEPLNAALERAIKAQNLVPLYLCLDPTIAVPKPMSAWVLLFLVKLKRVRVEDVDDEMLGVMRECGVCKQGPAVGAQISVLGSCNHAFHSKCIVRLLEDTNLCPLCHVPAYREAIASRSPIIRPKDTSSSS